MLLVMNNYDLMRKYFKLYSRHVIKKKKKKYIQDSYHDELVANHRNELISPAGSVKGKNK